MSDRQGLPIISKPENRNDSDSSSVFTSPIGNKELQLHDCITSIKSCFENMLSCENLKPKSTSTAKEKAVFYVKKEFLECCIKYLRKLYFFYITYKYLKYLLQSTIDSLRSTYGSESCYILSRTTRKQNKLLKLIEQKTSSLYDEIDEILSALSSVINYQCEFNFQIFKTNKTSRRALTFVIKNDLGKEILRFIEDNNEICSNYNQGALSLCMTERYSRVSGLLDEVRELIKEFPQEENRGSLDQTSSTSRLDSPSIYHTVEAVQDFIRNAGIQIEKEESILCDVKSYASTVVQRMSTLPLLLSNMISKLEKEAASKEKICHLANTFGELTINVRQQIESLQEAKDYFEDRTFKINKTIRDIETRNNSDNSDLSKRSEFPSRSRRLLNRLQIVTSSPTISLRPTFRKMFHSTSAQTKLDDKLKIQSKSLSNLKRNPSKQNSPDDMQDSTCMSPGSFREISKSSPVETVYPKYVSEETLYKDDAVMSE